MPLKAVLFDASGTLIHLDRPFILEKLAHYDVRRSEAELLKAADAAKLRVETMLASDEPGDETSRARVYSATLLDELGCSGMARERIRYAVGERLRAGRLWSYTMPGTADALLAMKEKMNLLIGVVANADGRAESQLERAGLAVNIDVVVDSGRFGTEKPDPKIFKAACKRLGVDPADAIHVGDEYDVDVVGARAAGIEPILFDPLGLERSPDCIRIETIQELTAIVMERLGITSEPPQA